MKTIIIYNDIENPLQFLIVDGDYSKFHGAAINSLNGTGFENEFCDWMWNKENGERNNVGQWSEDKFLLENKEWDKIAIVTWLP